MADTRSNILLVTVDSLRADAVYGEEVATPQLDELASQSQVYTNAFAQGPFTTFSMPSLFTSRYPISLPYVKFSDSTVGVYIKETPSLPEVLKEAGYATAGFHSNPLLSHIFGFNKGFDVFNARLPFSNSGVLPGRLKILADKLFRLIRKHAYLPAGKLNERAIEWIDERPTDRPFFLWVHYMDVHGPYQSKTGNSYLNKYRGEQLWRKAVTEPKSVTDAEKERLRDLYAEEVSYTDHCIGTLLEGLQDQDVLSDTVTVVTADHGEQFGEHGTYSHPHQLYDELTHIPLLISDGENERQEQGGLVELIDVAPTLVTKVGATSPDTFVGQSLEARVDADRPVISEANLVPHYTGAVRTPQWKYIREGAEEKLFDLGSDPVEQDNVAADRARRVADLSDRLDTHIVTHTRDSERDITEQSIGDSEIEDRLKDLGYLEK